MAASGARVEASDLLERAAAILEGGEYADLTVDALTRAFRSSRTTLYKHFSGKEGVVLALVDRICVKTEADLSGWRRMEVPARVGLRALMEVYAAHSSRVPRALLTSRAQLPVRCQQRLDGVDDETAVAFEGTVRKGVHAGDFVGLAPSVVTATWLAAARSGAIAAARGELAIDRAAAVRQAGTLVMDGLLPR